MLDWVLPPTVCDPDEGGGTPFVCGAADMMKVIWVDGVVVVSARRSRGSELGLYRCCRAEGSSSHRFKMRLYFVVGPKYSLIKVLEPGFRWRLFLEKLAPRCQ